MSNYSLTAKFSWIVFNRRRRFTSWSRRSLQIARSCLLKTTRKSFRRTLPRCSCVWWFWCSQSCLAVRTSTNTKRIMSSIWVKTKVLMAPKAPPEKARSKQLRVPEWWANCRQSMLLPKTKALTSILIPRRDFWNLLLRVNMNKLTMEVFIVRLMPKMLQSEPFSQTALGK